MTSLLFGPCAKRRTQAVLTTLDGQVFAAENVCLNPQPVCPREPGEGYEKCRTICQQVGHSEAAVVALAGPAAKGSTIRCSHWYACDACAAICKAAGVAEVVFTSPQDSERTVTP
jgi:deoxycytidylate deaminase